jgi:putative transposase
MGVLGQGFKVPRFRRLTLREKAAKDGHPLSGCVNENQNPDLTFWAPVFFVPFQNEGAPSLRFLQGWVATLLLASFSVMPRGLHRYYGADHLHFITCSCYRRLPLLRSARSRDRLLSVLEQTRMRYRFVVVGYVIMPEHIHLLLSEPEVGNPSTVMQVLKQRTARALLPKSKVRDERQIMLFGELPVRAPFWQTRFYDFNVWTEKKRVEKLRYMHRNPVKRGLVAAPEEWRWSSYRFYFLGEPGVVRVNEGWGEISFRAPAA